jgi:hypothetical protein
MAKELELYLKQWQRTWHRMEILKSVEMEWDLLRKLMKKEIVVAD